MYSQATRQPKVIYRESDVPCVLARTVCKWLSKSIGSNAMNTLELGAACPSGGMVYVAAQIASTNIASEARCSYVLP